MARMTKRLRFEIFRRDNFQCRYCGAKPPETELRVDHVIPEALGGPTEPHNLVTACVDCNSGKTSIAPDTPLVDDVRQDALRWARAAEIAAQTRRDEWRAIFDYRGFFTDVWNEWAREAKRRPVPALPGNYLDSIDQFRARGLPEEDLFEAVRVAMNARSVPPDNVFRYFCGVAWRMVGDLQQRAMDIVQTLPEDGN